MKSDINWRKPEDFFRRCPVGIVNIICRGNNGVTALRKVQIVMDREKRTLTAHFWPEGITFSAMEFNPDEITAWAIV